MENRFDKYFGKKIDNFLDDLQEKVNRQPNDYEGDHILDLSEQFDNAECDLAASDDKYFQAIEAMREIGADYKAVYKRIDDDLDEYISNKLKADTKHRLGHILIDGSQIHIELYPQEKLDPTLKKLVRELKQNGFKIRRNGSEWISVMAPNTKNSKAMLEISYQYQGQFKYLIAATGSIVDSIDPFDPSANQLKAQFQAQALIDALEIVKPCLKSNFDR